MRLGTFFLPVAFFSVALTNSSTAQMSTNVPTSVSSNSGRMVSTAPDMGAWTDPALNHNKLIQQQQGDGGYKLMGAYKVVGSPYLFGQHHKGDMFATEAKAYNIFISYNTYNQEVEFYSTSNPDKPLIKEPGTVDSFIIQQDLGIGISNPLKFIYGSSLGVKDKFYFQEIYKGAGYSLYKRYRSDLGYVSGNYIQSDLRQLDLLYDYYYSENGKTGLKKLKTNAASILKEFKDKKDISPVFSDADFTKDQDASLRTAFEFLNQ